MTYLLRLSLETLYVMRARARLLQSLDKDIKQIKFERTHTFLFIVFRHAYQRVTRFLSVSSHFSLSFFFFFLPLCPRCLQWERVLLSFSSSSFSIRKTFFSPFPTSPLIYRTGSSLPSLCQFLKKWFFILFTRVSSILHGNLLTDNVHYSQHHAISICSVWIKWKRKNS